MERVYEKPWRPNYEKYAFMLWAGFVFVIYQVQSTVSLPPYPFWVMLAIGILFAFMRGKAAWYRHQRLKRLKRIRLSFITSKKLKKISSPKEPSTYLGKGFLWTPNELQLVSEIEKIGVANIIGKKAAKNWSYYIHGVGDKEENIDYPLKLQDGHTLIVGTTGAGKTRTYDVFIDQAIERGEPVIIFDPKGDHELRENARKACERRGQGHKFVCFHPAYPESSARLDPLRNWNRPTELASRIATLIPSETGADPFTAFSWMVLDNIVNGLLAVEERPNIVKLRRYIDGEPGPLVTRVLRKYFEKNVSHWEDRVAPYLKKTKGREIDAYIQFYQGEVINENPNSQIDGLINSYAHNRDHMQKMTASLLPILNMLTTSTLGPLLSPEPDVNDSRPIIDMAKICEKGYVAYVGLDSLSDGTVGSAIGSVMLADLTAVAGDRYNYAEEKPCPVNIFIDEAAEIINQPTIQMLNKGRGAGFRLFVATQTLADFDVRTGSEASTRKILGNLNNKYILRVTEAELQKTLSETISDTVIKAMELSYRSGSSQTEPGDFTGAYGEVLKETESKLIPPYLFGKLPNLHYFAIFATGEIYKGYVPILKN